MCPTTLSARNIIYIIYPLYIKRKSLAVLDDGEIALSVTGKKPEECLFVDNSVKNLLAAAELGIEPVLFNRDHEEYAGMIVNSFPELAALLDQAEADR